MKTTTLRITGILTLLFMFFACKKELSVENGGFSGAAAGTLLDVSGNCQDIVVNGKYVVDTTLTDSNYIKLKVNFSSQGKYLISSDTVNGMWFLDSGFALSTGTLLVKVKGKGKPLLANTSDYNVSFNGNSCVFSVTTTNDTTSSSGGGTGGGAETGYFPLTTGSAWTYQYSPKLGGIDTFRVTATGMQVTYDTLTYYKFGTSLSDTFYYARNATIGNYYTVGTVDFDYIGIFDSVPSKPIVYPFFKERAEVGDTWESGEYGTLRLPGSGSTYERGKAKIIFTVVAKNSTITVSGKSYTNIVTQVKRELRFMPDNGAYRTLVTGVCYYAKGYGLILQQLGASPNAQIVQVYREPAIR